MHRIESIYQAYATCLFFHAEFILNFLSVIRLLLFENMNASNITNVKILKIFQIKSQNMNAASIYPNELAVDVSFLPASAYVSDP